VAFALELKSAVSAHNNTLGVYRVAADGTVLDVDIVFAGTLAVAAGQRTVNLGTPGNNEQLGFFLIQDGFDLYGILPDDLSFVMPGTGAPADLDSGVPPVLRSATRGDLTAAPIFHSFATFNPADGVAPGGRDLQIGFEDLPIATGDGDLQDVVIDIRVSLDDRLIL
jgi:serralysin